MNSIKKIKIIIALVLATCILSCSDENKHDNSLLKPDMFSRLTKQIVEQASLQERTTCVEYAANPTAFASRQSVCAAWLQKHYNIYAQTTAFIAQDASAPTVKNFIDPAVWQIMWNTYGATWQTDLVTEQATQAQVLQAPQQKKTQPAQTKTTTQSTQQVQQQQATQAQKAAAAQAVQTNQAQQQAKQTTRRVIRRGANRLRRNNVCDNYSEANC